MSSELDVPEQNHAIDDSAFLKTRGVVAGIVGGASAEFCGSMRDDWRKKANNPATTATVAAVTTRSGTLNEI